MPSKGKYTVFEVLTFLVCELTIYIYRHREGRTGAIDRALIIFQGQVQKVFFSAGGAFRRIWDHYIWLVKTGEKNEELEKELFYLRTKLAAAQEIELENTRLREVLGFKQKVEQKLLLAHVVGHDVSSDFYGIRIDRGSDDGVTPGFGVISSNGLVGRVYRISRFYSDVLTLLDPASNIDSVIQRSRARGILSGQAKQLSCKLRYIDRLDDVVVDDVVISSGYMDVFPKGLLIGHVSAVIPNPNAVLQTVIVKAAVNIYQLEEVFVVFPTKERKKLAHEP